MLVILVGPKGSGKSHLGRLLERRFGIHFFHVEPLWMRYDADSQAAGLQPAIRPLTAVAVVEAVRRRVVVIVVRHGDREIPELDRPVWRSSPSDGRRSPVTGSLRR